MDRPLLEEILQTMTRRQVEGGMPFQGALHQSLQTLLNGAQWCDGLAGFSLRARMRNAALSLSRQGHS